MIRRQTISFKNAVSGIIWVLQTQTNFKIHLSLSFLAIAGGFILNISYGEFLVVLVLVSIGLAIETVNTAIEEAIDAIHKEHSEEIKIAKDVSAAAMLIFSIGSFIIAFIIFIPKILLFLKF